MRITVNVPSTVSIAVIEGALQALGATIVQRKARTTAAEVEYPPLHYKKRIHVGASDRSHYLAANPDALEDDKSAYIPMEMDGISVLRAMRKIDNARLAYNRADGRKPGQFPEASVAEKWTTAQYVECMERRWSLKPCAVVA